MKKTILSFILLFILTGCWNYQELNDYAIVTGMAIDYTNNEFEISLLIANGNKQEEENAQVTVSSAKGKSIHEAIKNISLSTPKNIYISHLSVIVISEEMAKQGLNSSLDFLMRETQSHQNFYLVISKDAPAKDALSILAPLSEYPSQNIASNIKVTEETQGRITNASFNQFIGKILEKGIDPVANSLIIVGSENEGTNPEKQKESTLDNYTKLDTLALFRNDKLVGWATNEESIGINLLLNNIDNFYLQIPCNSGNIVTIIKDYKIKNKIAKDKIIVNIEAQGNINEMSCNIDLGNEQEIKNIEKKAEHIMKNYANKAIDKAKKLKVDIFGYGNQIYHKYPKYFNSIDDWNSEFTNLEIEVNTKFTITNTGAAKKNLDRLEE